jgi:DNA repair protein RadD
MELRKNQPEAINKAVEFFQQKKTKPSVVVLPTAWGKSILAGEVSRRLDERIIVVQPSKELLAQNFKKYIALGGQGAGIFSASFNSRRISQVTFATIGSITKYGSIFKDYGFSKMLVDEADRFPRESDSMIGRFIADAGITHCLGMTATPFKLQANVDEHGGRYSKLVMLTNRSKKGNFYKEIIHVSQVQEMVEMGFWSPIIYKVLDFDSSRLIYNTSKSEFTEESINKNFESQHVSDKIIRELDANPDRKSCLIFVNSVADAVELASRRRSAAVVSALTPAKERDRIIEAFIRGQIRELYNVNVLSVGFDFPGIDMILMGRSTASLSWYYQVIGRGTRIDPTRVKKDCLVVDFAGNFNRFGRVEDLVFEHEHNMWRLFGANDRILTGVPMDKIVTRKDLEAEVRKRELKKQGVVLPPEIIFPTAEVVIDFGKFRGQKVSKLPKWYIKFLAEAVTEDANNRIVVQEAKRLYSIQ